MSTNTENIEARLCAFLEGDLDEQGKAEIEKHLETHPAHAALLEELKRTKVMLMSLPRENAPADLAETLQGHLERSVLLDGVGTDQYETTLKINRWPQLMSVAAVVLLAVGLGVLVYAVLPQHSSAPVAMSTKDGLIASNDSNDVIKPNEGSLSKRERNSDVEDKELGKIGSKSSDVVAVAPGAPPGDSAKPGSLDVTLGTSSKAGSSIVDAVEDGGRRFGKGSLDAKNAGKLSANPAPEASRVYVVVSTDNLEATNGQLAGYLTANKIAWQPVNRGVFETQSSTDLAVFSRANNQQYRLNMSGNYNADYSAVNNAGVAKKSGDNNYSPYAQNSNFGDSSKKNSDLQNVNAGGGGGMAPNASNGLNQNGAVGADNLTQNTAAQGKVSQNGEPLTLNNSAIQQSGAPVVPGSSYNLAESKSGSVIVARGLTRQQAVELGHSLDRLYAGQSTVVIDRNDVGNGELALAGGNKAEGTKGLEEPKQRVEPANVLPTTVPSTTQPAETAQNGPPTAVAIAPTTEPAAEESKPHDTKSKSDLVVDVSSKDQTPAPQVAQPESNPSRLSIQAKLRGVAADEPVEVVIVVQPPLPANAGNPPGAVDQTNPAAPATQPTEPVQTVPPTSPTDVPPPTTMPTEAQPTK